MDVEGGIGGYETRESVLDRGRGKYGDVPCCASLDSGLGAEVFEGLCNALDNSIGLGVGCCGGFFDKAFNGG